MGKGDETRAAILDRGLDLASTVGLEGLTIGALAKQAGMSKSGLYAHFDSKEGLQRAVLEHAAERFVAAVFVPAMAARRGLPRLRALFANWLEWDDHGTPGSCPFIGAAAEYDDRPGPVRELLADQLRQLFAALSRAASLAVEEGEFAAEVDGAQFAYEFWGLILANHQFGRLIADAGEARRRAERSFEALIDRYCA